MKIWLVWAVNVGKSTLFNILIWNHRSIVTEIPWTTRDLLKDFFLDHENNCHFIYDSPWLNDLNMELENINKIIEVSDLIIFIFDFQKWITNAELLIKQQIFDKWKKKNCILVVNKMDKKYHEKDIQLLTNDFYSFWFENIIWLSAKSWNWIDELKQEIVKFSKTLKPWEQTQKLSSDIKISIIWRPNVGKSTLLNRFIWEQVSKVDDKPWTTLDYISYDISYKWKIFNLIDTSWIRRKWKINWLEKISFDKTSKMLEYFKPICIVLFDINEWIVHNDLIILSNLKDKWFPLMIWINKIDLKDKKYINNYINDLKKDLKNLDRIPIVSISWKDWLWLNKLLDQSLKIIDEYWKRVSTNKINNLLKKSLALKPFKFTKNRVCKISYAVQTWVNPPEFVLFVNNIENVNFAFKRYIENIIRAEFWFIWSPIYLKFKNK